MLTVSDHRQLLEGAPLHAHTGGRRGHPRATKTGLVDLGDRPARRKDRRTVRAYLDGKRRVGVRAPTGDDAFARYLTCCTARLREDPHLWATALFDEVTALGYDRSYPSFTRSLRLRGVRPVCEPCHPAKGRPVAVIEHPARGGNPMGLGGVAEPTGRVGRVRQEGIPVGGGTVSLQQVAWGAV